VASSVGTGGLSPTIRWPRCETDNSPLYSAKVKNEWSCKYLKYEVLILEIQHMWNVKAEVILGTIEAAGSILTLSLLMSCIYRSSL
jgi:hypothetical protein